LELKDFSFTINRKKKIFKHFELISEDLLNQKVKRSSFLVKTYLVMLRSAWTNLWLSKVPAA